jgi:carbon-monoxide dehydrogenase large subunit
LNGIDPAAKQLLNIPTAPCGGPTWTEDVMTDLAGTTRYAGTRVPRVEDPRLLTGRGTYVDDVVRPGMLHACFVRSPFARARIESIDTSEALALPGVEAIYLADDLNPSVADLWYTLDGQQGMRTPLPPLAAGQVRFVGDPVALVVAESRYVAEDAVELVVVDYDPLPPIVDFTTADQSDERVHEDYKRNIAFKMPGPPPDAVDEALAGAAHTIDEMIAQQCYTAVPMETRGIVAEWVGASQEMTIWSSTQSAHEVRAVCSRVLDLPESRIRVVMRDTGGGFGQKVLPQREDVCVMLAARRLPAALKWIEDRRENLMSAGQARHEQAQVRMGIDAEGVLVAAAIDHRQDVGAYPLPSSVTTGVAVPMIFPGPYRIPQLTFNHTSLFTNSPGRTAYRGPWQFESLAREVCLDLLAREAGLDPVELRRRNMLSANELPYASPSGMTYDSMSPRETFEEALSILDYDAFRREQGEARAAGRYLGVGTSSYVEPTTPGYGYYGTEGATIRIDPAGKVYVYVAGGSTGNSLETAVVQLTADALGVPIEDVNTIQGDTAITPYGAGTGGSRSGGMIAGAVSVTAAVLREKLVAIAAHQLEAAPEDIELVDGRAQVRGTPTAGVTVAEMAATAYLQPSGLPAGMSPGLEATERYTAAAMSTWANASHVCTCEVDVVTGQVRLLRYIVAEDCGPMINPSVVEGQIAGGTVQGIGGALLEELAYDEDGNPLATTFMDYLLPTMADVPEIEYGHVVTPGPGPGGYKGVGEGGAIGAPPAVVNAVADALAPLGVKVTKLPLGPATVVELIDQARSPG